MTKKRYRICLTLCLVVVILVGVLYYQKMHQNKDPKDDNVTLVDVSEHI